MAVSSVHTIVCGCVVPHHTKKKIFISSPNLFKNEKEKNQKTQHKHNLRIPPFLHGPGQHRRPLMGKSTSISTGPMPQTEGNSDHRSIYLLLLLASHCRAIPILEERQPWMIVSVNTECSQIGAHQTLQF